jgi:hypothetical protein
MDTRIGPIAGEKLRMAELHWVAWRRAGVLARPTGMRRLAATIVIVLAAVRPSAAQVVPPTVRSIQVGRDTIRFFARADAYGGGETPVFGIVRATGGRMGSGRARPLVAVRLRDRAPARMAARAFWARWWKEDGGRHQLVTPAQGLVALRRWRLRWELAASPR